MRLKHSKLTTIQTSRLCEHFVAGTPARTVAELVGVNKNTAVLLYHRLREIIATQIEVDECYFGGVRKGKRGGGAAGKVPVVGILKRGGRVYTKMIPNARAASIMPIVQTRIEPDSIVYSDAFSTYDVLDVSGFRHHCINHRETFVLDGSRHINGIENFWNQAKHNLRRYNGIPKHHFNGAPRRRT